jgi:hypothetical protein
MHSLVENYLNEQFKNLQTKCTMMVIEIPGSAPPWLGKVDGPSFHAAESAIKVCIHGTTPLYVRTKHIVVIDHL